MVLELEQLSNYNAELHQSCDFVLTPGRGHGAPDPGLFSHESGGVYHAGIDLAPWSLWWDRMHFPTSLTDTEHINTSHPASLRSTWP